MTQYTKKVVAQNRRASFDYHILEKYEAGIVLTGTEVKSLRAGKASIGEAHADLLEGAIYLFNANIPEYLQANQFNHYAKRPRKLLLHKDEIKKLIGKIKIKGLTLVPLSLYFNEKNRVKCEIAIAQGKKLYDKRETIKQREWERNKAKELKDKSR